MKCFENSIRAQLYAAIIAVTSLVVAFPASEGHHIGQIKERIGGWQRQIAEMWVTDTCKAMDFATNIVASIKAVGDVGMRRKLATDYACFILELDVTHRCNTTDPMFRRRFLLYDAIELLDLSAEGVFAKWRIRLDYCRHLKMEAEWLLNAAGTNLPMSGFAMTGEVVVVSGADIAKKYGQPHLLNDGKRIGYQNPNDSPEFTRRRKSQNQRAYSKILKEELEDQAQAFNGDTFKRDYESLSVVQKLELQRTMEEVFGCEKGEVVLSDDTPPKSGLQAAIDELPKKLDCRRWREVDRFAYSNICCAVRLIDDREKRLHYTIAYTNKVSTLMPAIVGVRTEEQLEAWRVRTENYVDLVRWGYALLDENAPKDVGEWDFLLGPIILMRREIELHKKWLVSKGTDSRRVEKNYHVRMLEDLLEKCQREIITCWYEGAKHSLSSHQLEIVRQKVREAFGELPSEMGKD